MRTIEIPDPLFERIKKNAEPLVDTAATVIERWADHYEKAVPPTKIKDPSVVTNLPKGDVLLPIHLPPDLFHTVVNGEINNQSFTKWNDLLRIALGMALKKAGSFEELRRHTQANILKGKQTKSGYRFIPEFDISIQNVDANHAWAYSLALAKYLNCSIRVRVEWRHNPKAARPGKTGVLAWKPD